MSTGDPALPTGLRFSWYSFSISGLYRHSLSSSLLMLVLVLHLFFSCTDTASPSLQAVGFPDTHCPSPAAASPALSICPQCLLQSCLQFQWNMDAASIRFFPASLPGSQPQDFSCLLDPLSSGLDVPGKPGPSFLFWTWLYSKSTSCIFVCSSVLSWLSPLSSSNWPFFLLFFFPKRLILFTVLFPSTVLASLLLAHMAIHTVVDPTYTATIVMSICLKKTCICKHEISTWLKEIFMH